MNELPNVGPDDERWNRIAITRRTPEQTRAYLEAELAKPGGDRLKELVDVFGGFDAFVDFCHVRSSPTPGE